MREELIVQHFNIRLPFDLFALYFCVHSHYLCFNMLQLFYLIRSIVLILGSFLQRVELSYLPLKLNYLEVILSVLLFSFGPKILDFFFMFD